MGRLTDNDRNLGPLTWAKASWNPWRLVFSTGGGDGDGESYNHLTAYAFGYVARLRLPTLMKPWRQWVDTSKYAWANNSGGYWDEHPREYGFSLHEGFLTLFLGPQTGDSTTEKSWHAHLPWTQWRFIRRSYFDNAGVHFYTEWERNRRTLHNRGNLCDAWEAHEAVRAVCPVVKFEVDDFDGTRLIVTTRIEEREWRFGEGWFKWLSVFRKPKVRRTLDINFNHECGPEKGSWKGGLMGTGIDMLPGELHEAAFRRYCDQEHRSKYSRYRITFVGVVA